MKDSELIEQFNAKSDIEVISTKTLYKGFFQLDEYKFKHKLFSGGWSEVVTREV